MDSDEISESITFREDDQFASFVAFEDMRRKVELCDIKIKIGNRAISAHRVILAAGIPYFREVFRSNSVENGEIEIPLGDITPRALESLIQYAYCRKLTVSTKNVYSILQASHFFQLYRIRETCEKFLAKRLDVTNVVQVHRLACNLRNMSLLSAVNQYLLQHFEEFSKCNDFLKVSYDNLKTLISDNNLKVTCEKTVFEAVMKWVQHSPSERQFVLPDLLSEVRMVYLPVTYLVKTVASIKLVRASPDCVELVDNVKNFHLLPKDELANLNLTTTPRSSYVNVKNVSGKIDSEKIP